MFQKSYALYAPEGEGPTGGGAAEGDHHQDGGQGKDGEVVPKTQFIAAINSANRKAAALEAQVKELAAKLEAAAKPADQPKRYTRAELNALVADRQITQEQADAQWETQLREELRAEANNVARETITTAKRNEFVASEIERYKAVAPEILDETHETRRKIQAEFDALVELGDDPRQLATQLKAIRAVLGPVSSLEKGRGGRDQHETHRETGGSGGSGSRPSKGNGKLVDQLPAHARKHYEKGIEQGRYKDWSEVEAELKYASPAVRQRMGLAA